MARAAVEVYTAPIGGLEVRQRLAYLAGLMRGIARGELTGQPLADAIEHVELVTAGADADLLEILALIGRCEPQAFLGSTMFDE